MEKSNDAYLKKCYECGEIKEKFHFDKNKNKRDGLASCCRVCSKWFKPYYAARNRAKKKGLECDLNIDWYREKLKLMKCEVTGVEFSIDNTGNTHFNSYMPSVDRIDSNKGYTKDNCQLVAYFYNNMKSQHSKEEFEHLIKIIYENVVT